MRNIWSEKPELLQRLIELNAEGEHSLSDIARILGHGLTRNACCGKLHRIKIEVKNKQRPAKPRDRRRAMPKAPPPPAPMVPADAGPVAPVRNGELQNYHCKWPHGDPATREFRFCGARRESIEAPYCAEHNRRAINPQSRKSA